MTTLSHSEQSRLQALTLFEKNARARGFSCIAGVDEAGRGPLAGPVVAAACILPDDILVEGINDSKKLLPSQRFALFQKLLDIPGICYAIGVVDALRIDQINILKATFEAMLIAIHALSKKPDYLLIDGNRMPQTVIPGEPIIKGDALSQSIAAASIIAKESRDRMMDEFHQQWPQYGFDRHKGYGTKEHLLAIERDGPCPIHRLTFEPLKSRVLI
ncbi:MAG: ribonuclease HII [Verrucomicrobia bacterium]|nr:ribonuclease HII [Verrucomicrobiota bacterium]